MELALSPMETGAVAMYDEYIRAGDTSDTPIWVDHFSRHIFRDVPADGEVVDVGCRIGRVISILPELGITNYVGIDPSAASIDYCKKQWEFTGHTFEVGEVRGLGATYPGIASGLPEAWLAWHVFDPVRVR